MTTALSNLLDRAFLARAPLLDEAHESAFRLFNGFTEGCPALAIDVYGRTAVLHDYSDERSRGNALVHDAMHFLETSVPWVTAVVRKVRAGKSEQEKNGTLVRGDAPDTKIREHGVWYAIDLTMNRDASLYLDTRNLRAWALGNLAGKRVLNTFAYTASLGVAAMAGGASGVLNADLNKRFLAVGRASYALNRFAVHKADFQASDFWPHMSRLNQAGERFDCVFLDPPFYSATAKGVVDLEQNITRLINKVRPLINDGGVLVAINNALFVPGAAYMAELNALCASGYLGVEELIPVPDDFVGYPQTRIGTPVTDPAPFNHATKIAVLRVRRKA